MSHRSCLYLYAHTHGYIYECNTNVYTATKDTIVYGTCESNTKSLETILKGKPLIQFTNKETSRHANKRASRQRTNRVTIQLTTNLLTN